MRILTLAPSAVAVGPIVALRTSRGFTNCAALFKKCHFAMSRTVEKHTFPKVDNFEGVTEYKKNESQPNANPTKWNPKTFEKEWFLMMFSCFHFM